MKLEISRIEDCDIILWYDLPENVKENLKDNYSTIEESSFFLYRDDYYDLNDFMRFDVNGPSEFNGYHAYKGDSFFSGTVIKLNDSGDGITVATYISKG